MNANSADEVLHIYTNTMTVDETEGSTFQTIRGYYTLRILILVNSDQFGTAEDELLIKMLTACKLKEDDYQLVATPSIKGIHAYIASQNPETVMLFGLHLDTDMVQLNKALYKPFRFNNIKMLLSDSLAKLNAQAELKSLLWTNGLKPLFKLN